MSIVQKDTGAARGIPEASTQDRSGVSRRPRRACDQPGAHLSKAPRRLRARRSADVTLALPLSLPPLTDAKSTYARI